ncbi:MAG: AMP-binding protein [Actinobacteria bacterium]|nr:AMP-binding protein [Actinomycetota bacterium]
MPVSPLLDHLVARATTTPGATLLTFPPEDRRDPISYGDAVTTIRGLAAALSVRGLGVGDRLVAQIPTSAEAVLTCLAAQWVGGVYVPLNPALGIDETSMLTDDADPTISLHGTDAVAELMAEALDELFDEGHQAAAPTDRPVPRSEDDPAAIIYTSGTTGRPKGAIVTHGNLASNAEALASIWGFGPGDVTVHALPTFHAHGLFVAVNTALVAGSSLLFLGRFDVDRVIDALAGPGTVLMGVPTFWVRLLASERFTRELAGGVRLFISGSAPLTEKVFGEFEARTGQRILERYGMSETEMIASNPLDGERVAGSVGFALPGVGIRIRCDDDPTRPLAANGDTGGIEVTGPNVFAGYRNMPERRSVDFTDDGWFRTGDLGTLDAEGRLRIVGRAKHLIISGGENVYPAEIEMLIDQMPGVAESAVVGMPDDEFGELGLAVIVPGSGQTVDLDAVLATLRGRLAGFKVPRMAVITDRLPRNAMGKVLTSVLQRRFADEWARRPAQPR